MPQRNVATNFTFEQQRLEINLLAQDFWAQKGTVDTASTTYLKHDGSNAFTGQTLAVPNAFTINPNSGGGTVTIAGNLDVTGTTTTVSSANLEVTDKNILIAKGSTSDANSDGAGITIDSSTDITFNFVDAKDALVSSIGLEATTFLKGPYGQFTGSGTPTTGQGVEVNAPDANTGQIASYDRGNTAYKELRVKGSSVGVYTGTTNALAGTFNSTGLTMESGKTITGNVTGDLTGTVLTAAQTNITSVGTLTGLSVSSTSPVTIRNAGEAQIDIGYSATKYAQIGRSTGGTYQFISQEQGAGLEFGVSDASDGAGVVHMDMDRYGAVTIGHDVQSGNPGQKIGKTTIQGHHVNSVGSFAELYFSNSASSGGGTGSTASIRAIREGDNIGTSLSFYTQVSGGSAGDGTEKLRIAADGNVTVEAGLLSAQGGQAYASSANDLATSVTKAAFRVKGANNSSDSLWMGVETTDANPYIQGNNDAGNNAKKLLLNPFGGNVGVGLVNPDCELHVKGAGSVARFEGTGGSSFIDLYDSDDNTRCFVGVDGGTFKVQTSADGWSDKLSVTPAGVVIVGIDNNDTDHTNNSLPAGASGLYTQNRNGTSGTFSAISLIATSTGAAADQSASLVAKCTGSGLSPEVYLTQRDGSNSQRNTLAINTLGDATFIGRVSDYKGDLRTLPRNEPSALYTLATSDKGKFISNGSNITLDNSATWNTGDVVTIFNYNASSTIQIISGTGVLIHYTDGTSATTGTRTLAAKGLCTLLCVEGANNTFVISGALT